MTMREALYRSQNIPAVKCLDTITPELGFSYLENSGLTTLVSPENAINGVHDVIESLALGGMTLGVYNIDMCAAYALYANDGVYTKPIYYTKVYDHDGNLLLDNSQPETQRVVKESTAWLLTSAMQSVVTQGTGTKCKIPNQPVAGKTGTSNSDGDLWFVGFTPYYTAAIWTGYDDDASRDVGAVDHRTMWSKIMTEIHANLPTKSFSEKPDDVIEVSICKQSGQLAGDLCTQDERGSQVITEYYAKGTEPTETCTAHGVYPICMETNKLSIGTCPASFRIMVKRPPNNTVVPDDAKNDVYEVADDAYTIAYEAAAAICPVHGASYLEQLGITPGSTSTLTVDDLLGNSSFDVPSDDGGDDGGNHPSDNNE